MKRIHVFPEQLSGSSTRSDKNGDREETLVEPEDVPVMLITSADRSTKVPSGRKGVFKRFRRWTGKRLRTMCCVGPQRDGSSCRKDARSDEIVDNIGIEPFNENPARKTNNEVERNIKVVKDPLIITNERNTIVNSSPMKEIIAPTSVSSVRNIVVNDNTKSLDDNPAGQMSSGIVRKREEHDSVNKTGTLISENQRGDLQTMKPKRSPAIDHQHEIVWAATEVTHRLEARQNPIRKIRYDNENVSSSTSHSTIKKHDETVAADVEKRDGTVWVMDLLDYYTNEHHAVNNGPRADVDAVTFALRWGRPRRGRGTAATVPAETVGRNDAELESQTAVVDLDGSGRDVAPAAVGRKPCAVDADGGTAWNDDADYRRPIRHLADRLMSDKPCECDAPDGCVFYANVMSAIAAEARAAFHCRVTTSAAAVATTRDEPPKTARKVPSAWNSFFCFKNDRKTDDRRSAAGAATDGAVRKNRTKNVKHIQVAYKK